MAVQRKYRMALGILGAFVAGVLFTVFIIKPEFLTVVSGALLGSAIDPLVEEIQVSVCDGHEECPLGEVCQESVCLPAEEAFCSQPFMLAESRGGRFIRYTLCPNQCVRSGSSAYCE